MPDIPLANTSTVGELDDPFNLVNGLDNDDPNPFHPSDVICAGLRAVEIPAAGDDPEYIAGDMSVTFDTLSKALGRTIGRTRMWAPFTEFFGPETYRGITLPADFVVYDDQVFLVTTSFNSAATFEEKQSGTMVMERLTRDSDYQFLEMCGSAVAPLVVGSPVLRYLSIRYMEIHKELSLPNDRLDTDKEYLRAACNVDITTDLVLTMKRLHNGGSETVGTITFVAGSYGSDTWVQGDFVFNDAGSGSNAASLITLTDNTQLVIEATSIPAEIQWVTVNILGKFINYQSPYYNFPV